MTDIIILRICRRLHASPLLTWNIRNSRFLRVFDLSGPRRIVGAAILATGLTKKNTSQRLWTTCSHAHAEYSLSLTRYIIDEDTKKNPPPLRIHRQIHIQRQHEPSQMVCFQRRPSLPFPRKKGLGLGLEPSYRSLPVDGASPLYTKDPRSNRDFSTRSLAWMLLR